MVIIKEPAATRMERKKEKTKQAIISTAMRLFKEQGVDRTTMEQIAQEVDIAKATLYNYFPAKEAIIDEYIKRSFAEKYPCRMNEIRNIPDTRARLTYLFRELIRGVFDHREIFAKYLVYRMQIMVSFLPEEDERSGFHLVAAEIIELGRQNGEIRADLPPMVLIEFFEFAFIEMVKQLYMSTEDIDPGEIVPLYVDLCINGMTPAEEENRNG